MPRIKKLKVEEPKVEEPKVEEPKVEELKKVDTLGRYKIPIQTLSKRVLNGIEYNDVQLINGQTMLLSDKDLAEQINT